MLSHRIVTASAVFLAVAVGSAAAQDGTSVGKPLPLLQFAQHRARAPLHPHARAAEKLAKQKPATRRIAKTAHAKPHKILVAAHSHPAPQPVPEPAQAAPAAPQPDIWPAADAATPGAIALPAAPAAPQNVTTEQVVSDAPNAIVADAQIAQAAAPVEANAPAIAADPHVAAAEVAGPAHGAPSEPAVRAMLAAPAPEPNAKSPVGSASWMAQVLAALGGAIAAGAVSWFLILRRRSEPADEDFFAETLVPGE